LIGDLQAFQILGFQSVLFKPGANLAYLFTGVSPGGMNADFKPGIMIVSDGL
jgi:hypothetical protein